MFKVNKSFFLIFINFDNIFSNDLVLLFEIKPALLFIIFLSIFTFVVVRTGLEQAKDSTTAVPKFSPLEAKTVPRETHIGPHFKSLDVISDHNIYSSISFSLENFFGILCMNCFLQQYKNYIFFLFL